mmetsp:Transcript_85640/g.229129  ORF Transcript_85640/g.229129 Transcript_85640/m.229129 type:complete len:430 (-) Transcript_85640:416-1705(-)
MHLLLPTLYGEVCYRRFGCLDAPPVGGQTARWIPEVDSAELLFSHFLPRDEPVVVRGSSLLGRSVGRWSPDYIAKHAHGTVVHTFRSPNRYFSYYVPGIAGNPGGYPFEPPTDSADMTIPEAVARAHSQRRACLPAPAGSAASQWCSLYAFADGATFRDMVATGQLAEDRGTWDGELYEQIKKGAEWAGPAFGLGMALIFGQENSTMTAHYDSHSNVLSQVFGEKEVVIWAPEETDKMYPFPNQHSCARQSMVHVDNPDLVAHPRYKLTHPLRTVLQPGDFIFLPAGWWHHLRSVSHLSTSVAWWHDTLRPNPYSAPSELGDLLWRRGGTIRFSQTVWTHVETLVGRHVGPKAVDAVMAALGNMRKLVVPGFQQAFEEVRDFLLWVHKNNPEQAGKYMNRMVAGRFGVDHERFARTWYLRPDVPVVDTV